MAKIRKTTKDGSIVYEGSSGSNPPVVNDPAPGEEENSEQAGVNEMSIVVYVPPNDQPAEKKIAVISMTTTTQAKLTNVLQKTKINNAAATE
mgnify:CR=1 FL=1